MKNRLKKLTNLFLFFLFASCGGNEICFDINNQTIYSQDNLKINKLSIDEIKGDLIWITLKKEGIAEALFNLEKMDTLNFNYEKSGFTRSTIKQYALKPNSTYEIDNISDGDAASGKLTIKTNGIGKVYYSSIICD